MVSGNFKKESATARGKLGLDELVSRRAKTATRLLVFERSGMFDGVFLQEVRNQLNDYDRRIRLRQAQIIKQARAEMEKSASAAGVNPLFG